MAASEREVALKFASFLYTNKCLGRDFTIEKQQARFLYFEVFKKNNMIQGSFGAVHYQLRVSNLLIRMAGNQTHMYFNSHLLLNLIHNRQKPDLPARNGSSGRNLLAAGTNQNASFNSSTPVKGKIVSVKELKPEKLQFFVDGSPILDNLTLPKNASRVWTFSVKNVGPNVVKIVEFGGRNVAGIEFNPPLPSVLGPGENVEHKFLAAFPNEGVARYPVTLVTEKRTTYNINLVFHIHDPFYDDLHAREPYKKKSKPGLQEFIQQVDSGERPNFFPASRMLNTLKQYHMPKDVQMALNCNLTALEGMSDSQRAQINEIKKVLEVEDKKQPLQPKNHVKLLNLLLYIEEHQMFKDIKDYDVEDQVLVKTSNLMELQVPGLAEHRPSLIIGDSVFVREHRRSSTLYEGFVHMVKESSVLLKFSRRFMDIVFVPGRKFYVSFTFNRFPLKVEHQAVEFAKIDNISHLLFPKSINERPFTLRYLKWFNSNINNNPEQQQAVQAILQKTSMPSPYLIFGPPGTGKTMTVVEAVKQIHRSTSMRVLICTPSNSACNEVTRRLIDTIPKTDICRYIAVSVPVTHIPEEVKPYSNFAGGGYSQLSIEDCTKYRILVTTLVSAAKLVNTGCPQKHFAYVFIDESGQATETETLVPIARILSGSKSGVIDGQIVLAGDPRQLGPVIHSPLAREYAFGISMLERLIDSSQPYKRNASNKYNPNALTKLLKNYRSHPAIIAQPNTLFYENELESAGDNFINAAVGWDELPNPKFPMVFHSVVGLDQREKNSPSFFNVQEIQVVMSYLEKLIKTRMQGTLITEKQIAIISPYKKQVEKIKQACKKKQYSKDLTICSTEQIQGQEKLIVIITTVRSKLEMVKFDKKFHLGFLDNPKRFNVAITRAKALLIVIGNPNLLQYDKHWRSLIRYCRENNAVAGEPFELRNEDLEEVLNNLTSLSIGETDINRDDGGANFSRGNL